MSNPSPATQWLTFNGRARMSKKIVSRVNASQRARRSEKQTKELTEIQKENDSITLWG
ncbi:hypothetical protein NVP2275O_079 [Vibrio phage 2.275.O._10N.286.54.E11]|nr:hypothetical protein NVP2275O_079 [Vibrio phage 2.275.O._10N.286.54.E11]